ncbi:MAG TPA: hypothetical protein VIJ14_09405 [Rhabdochlamydiaceae bacterium]
MKNQDYKLKYQDLKLKFMDAVDVSFRLGVEQGLQQAQVQASQQAEAAAQQAAAMGQQPGQPGQEDEQSGDSGQFGQPQSDGSEMDQHISTLEGMLGSAKAGSPEQAQMQKSLDGLKSFRKSLKDASDLKKSEQAIKAIGKAMKTPFTLSKNATKNMSEPAKKALNSQEQIVQDLMKSFEEEEKKASEQITKTLNFENLIKE